jgi:glucose-6-phosphate isomerase
MSLALGSRGNDVFRYFPGNRPSSLLVLKDLSPERVGGLLSFYEAKTIFEAFVWGINPFDQFGVELGKTMATGIREAMAQKNLDADHDFADVDPISRHYLKQLYQS